MKRRALSPIRGTVTKAACEQDNPRAAQLLREMAAELYDMHQRVSAML